MAANVCWGIEIGSGAVKAVKLGADGEDVRVLDYAVVNHPKVLSTPDLDEDDALRVAMGTLTANYDLTADAVAVSMPGHQSFARFTKLPPVEPKKVPEIVYFEALQQIPFPPEDVEWDYQTFVSPDSPDVEVGIFAITKQRLMGRLHLLRDLGLTPDIATLSPLAAYNALAYDLEFTEQTPGTILLDIGTFATDLIVAEAGRIWIRTFPIGGHQFTDTLVSSFNLRYEKAERLKREAEQSKHARHVFQAMRPVFTDLVQEIQRSISAYQMVHKDAKLDRLIGLGSTFQLPGLRKYLKQQLGMNVYRLEQFKRPQLEGEQGTEFNKRALNLATAYGLALQGIGKGTLNANLMPVPVLRDMVWQRKRGWFAAATGLAAATAAAAFVRPLLDNVAFTSAERPTVISAAASDARRVAQQAEAAGVTEGGGGDLTAARILELTEGRDVYPQLVDDVNRMLAVATGAASGAMPEGATAAFSLERLETSFAPEGGEDGRRRGGRARPGASGEEEEGLNPDAFDRVIVRATVTSPLEFPEDAALPALTGWLGDNARRSGVPYVLHAGAPGFVISQEQIAVEDQPGRGGGTRATGVTRTAPTQQTGTGRGERRGGGRTGGGGAQPAPPPEDRSAAELIEEMERIAPIGPGLFEMGPPARHRYELRWSLLFDVPEEEEA